MLIRTKILSLFVLLQMILCFNLFAQIDSTERAGIELFPILSYDTDAGFGYGDKEFFYDQLKARENIRTKKMILLR